MPVAQARAKLDGFVSLRGSIAHRGVSSVSVQKATVRSYFGHLQQLVLKTNARVNRHLNSIFNNT